MLIRERVVGDVTIFEVSGKMTLGEGDEQLKDRTNRMLSAGRKKLILNLRGVPYIDSSGNGEIVRSYTSVSRNGGKLVLLQLTKRIVDLYRITKLLTVIELFDDELDALASFQEAGRTSICPVCRLHAAFSSRQLSMWTCANCSSEFTAHQADEGSGSAWVIDAIRVPTYEGEEIVLRSSWPWAMSINGRLDLFSVEAMEEAWRAVPRPRKVLVELGAACRMVSKKGLAALEALCRPDVDGGRTAVLFERGVAVDGESVPSGSPFFTDRVAALSVLHLGDMSLRPIVVEVQNRAR